jgi:RimJ/RimL family protein N-acetyltransferase
MQTAHLRLIAHTPEHLRALLAGPEVYESRFQIKVAEGVTEFLTGPEVSEAFLTRVREATESDIWRDGFGVVLCAEDRLIGFCSFNAPPDTAGAVEISYGIVPAYAGRGYATEAARSLLAQAAADDRVQLVRAHTLPEENASTRILRRCGFQFCGAIEDEVDGTIWRWEKPARPA